MAVVGPFTPLEYIQWWMSNSPTTIASSTVYLDNSNTDWQTSQQNGNTQIVQTDSTTNTITFYHSYYISQPVSSTVHAADIHPEMAAALGIDVSNGVDWNLALAGLGLVAIGIAIAVFAGWTGIGGIAAISLIAVGVATLAQAFIITPTFTPQLQSTTCTPDKTSCCSSYTSALAGLQNTCVTCNTSASSPECTQVTTQSGGIEGLFGSAGFIIIVVVVAIVIMIALYFLWPILTKKRGEAKAAAKEERARESIPAGAK